MKRNFKPGSLKFLIIIPHVLPSCIFMEMLEVSFSSTELQIFIQFPSPKDLSYRLSNIKQIIHKLKCNVFVISYRGYGTSTGEPSEPGLKLDAEAALRYLLSRDDIDSRQIIAFGRSLGGAVAIDLTARFQEHISALIVENTFSSILDMVDVLFPIFSYFKPLCVSPWLSLETIKCINKPVLFVSGRKDELVPPEMMDLLYEVCPSPDKVWKSFSSGTHNETFEEVGYYEALKKFVKEFVIF
eukprot:TRINITY_DN2846_c0_g1_i10.p1 TRINITY_DN2846_c0_g1~~TRINITY_DN2846_c0_g1_i10.p1  ORF type:complete len:242 (+),score=40.22 TRINITY_DN2846_c0_g1_i10:294-1019(+)